MTVAPVWPALKSAAARPPATRSAAILIEEVGFRRYRNRDLMLLAGWSLLELFWYRPLTAIWRTWATVLVVAARGRTRFKRARLWPATCASSRSRPTHPLGA